MLSLDSQERAANVERLLQEGRDLYEAGMADHAVAAWTEVLHIQPDEPRALEYLRSAGVTHGPEEMPLVQSGPTVRAELEHLLAERRYEDALQLLYAARRTAPDPAEISRGIQLIKQRLIRRYLHQIGNLDQVPRISPDLDLDALTSEENEIVRLADGIASFGDIAQESRLGRFETYRRLADLLARGAILVEAAAAPVAAAPVPEPVVAPAPAEAAPAPSRRSTTALVFAVLAVAAAGIAVAIWQMGRMGAAPPPVDAAVTAAVPPPPLPVVAVPDAAPAVAVAEPASPDAAPAPAVAIEEPQPAPAPIEIKPPERKPGRPSPARPPARVPVAVPAAPPDARVQAVAAPPEPPPTPTPTPTPAPVPTPPPPAPAKPAGPLDAEASTSGVTVQGSLTRAVVERGLGRIAGSFRACYPPAAQRAQRNAATMVQVSVTIGETGNAGDASASGGALPGLDECVRDVARRLHTEAPDVGVVHVTFTVTYKPLGP